MEGRWVCFPILLSFDFSSLFNTSPPAVPRPNCRRRHGQKETPRTPRASDQQPSTYRPSQVLTKYRADVTLLFIMNH